MMKDFIENNSSNLWLEYLAAVKYALDEKEVYLKIWHTAGLERLNQDLPKNFYKRVEGIFLVYDITNQKSFESIDIWMKRIDENAEENIPVILVGNKADLVNERKV